MHSRATRSRLELYFVRVVKGYNVFYFGRSHLYTHTHTPGLVTHDMYLSTDRTSRTCLVAFRFLSFGSGTVRAPLSRTTRAARAPLARLSDAVRAPLVCHSGAGAVPLRACRSESARTQQNHDKHGQSVHAEAGPVTHTHVFLSRRIVGCSTFCFFSSRLFCNLLGTDFNTGPIGVDRVSNDTFCNLI